MPRQLKILTGSSIKQANQFLDQMQGPAAQPATPVLEARAPKGGFSKGADHDLINSPSTQSEALARSYTRKAKEPKDGGQVAVDNSSPSYREAATSVPTPQLNQPTQPVPQAPRVEDPPAPQAPVADPAQVPGEPPVQNEPQGPEMVDVEIEGRSVQMTRDYYESNYAAKNNVPQNNAISQEDSILLNGAKYLREKFNNIPGLYDAMKQAIHSGKLPSELQNSKVDPLAELENDPSLTEGEKKILLGVKKMISPIAETLSETNNRQTVQSRESQARTQIDELNQDIDQSIKNIPALGDKNSSLSKELILSRLAQDRTGSLTVERAAASVAATLTERDTQSLERKIAKGEENKSKFRSSTGPAVPPVQPAKRQFTAKDWKDRTLRRAVDNELDNHFGRR